MNKEELKNYLAQQIDMMSDTELVELSDFLQGKSDEEQVAEELIVIKGEFKKLTKLVMQIENDAIKRDKKIQEKQLKPFVEFYSFMQNSKEALEAMPACTLWNMGTFKQAWGSFLNGFEVIDRLYDGVLQEIGLQRSAKVGEQFDANFHEAVAAVSDKNKEDGTIIEVLEEGFIYDNTILNYAKVKVNRWI